MKRKVGIFLLCLICARCSSKAVATEEMYFFDTPEAAIEHYVAAIARSDLADALSATILPVLYSGYDFSKYAEFGRSFQLFESSRLPSEYALYRDIMAAGELGKQATQIWVFCVTTLMPFDDLVNTVRIDSIEDAITMVEILDPAQMQSLSIRRIDTPARVEEWIKTGADQWMFQTEAYRAISRTHRIALIDGPSGLRMVGFRLVEMAGGWWIAFMEGTYDKSSASTYSAYSGGFAITVTEDEYLALLEMD